MAGITRLDLSDGQWVDVKDGLKVRDKRDQHSYSVDGMSTDGQTYRFNVVKHNIATAAVRILNWSLKATDDHGKPYRWPAGKSFKDRVDAIESLDEETFDEITRVVSEHEKSRSEASDEAKKSIPTGESDGGETSPSVN